MCPLSCIRILFCRPPTIIFKQQPTSSSLGMGKASHDEDLQNDPHQNVLNSSGISHTPGGGYESNPLHQTSFTSSNSHDFQPNNAQNFSKIMPSKTFDTQSLNLGNYFIIFDYMSHFSCRIKYVLAIFITITFF